MSQARNTQLKLPHSAFPLVRTDALADLCSAATPAAKVISVVAPTGYGKTALLAELHSHYQAGGAHCLWIGLQDRDMQLEDVLDLLELATHGQDDTRSQDDSRQNRESEAATARGLNFEQVIHEGDANTDDRIENLTAVFSRLPDPSIVILDNISACQDETRAQLFDALVFQTPTWVRFVFSGLTEPPINRARLLMQGGLREIDYRALSFGAREAAELFTTELCAQLGEPGMRRVLKLTEGWPAALRLARIILTRESDPLAVLTQLSGSDRDLGALLNHQVLQSFGANLRRFLCEIAPLERFCTDLCQYATGDANAKQHIDELLQSNALIIPLDRNGRWFRLHGLLREYLVTRAAQELPATRGDEILRRAAQWSEREGFEKEAVEQALRANAYPLASEILERNAAMFVRDLGSLRNTIDWVEKLHAAQAPIGRETEYWRIWALVFHRRYEYARRQMQNLSIHLTGLHENAKDAEAVREFRCRVDVIKVALEVFTDHPVAGLEMAARWLDERRKDDAPFDVATVATAAAICENSDCNFVSARRYLQLAHPAIKQSGSEYGRAWVSLLEGVVDIYEGDYTRASQRLRDAHERARNRLGEKSGIVGSIALVRAKCAVEMDDTDQARSLLQHGLRRFDSHGIVDTAAFGLEAGLKLWSGQDDALVSLAQLRELAGNYPPRLAACFSCFLVQRLVRLDLVDDAVTEAKRIGKNGFSGSRVDADQTKGSAQLRALQVLAKIDLAVAQGQLKTAKSLIDEEEAIARREGRWAHRVELALMEMTLAVRSPNTAPAISHLTRAINMAAKRQILRPFRDHAQVLAGLVNDSKPQSWGFTREEERKFFAEICRTLPLENSILLDQLEELDEESILLQTPTPRELELIGLIEAGLTNQQIADRLSVSVATVKWHLYNLYGKLNVSNRSAALARAKALNLLSH